VRIAVYGLRLCIADLQMPCACGWNVSGNPTIIVYIPPMCPTIAGFRKDGVSFLHFTAIPILTEKQVKIQKASYFSTEFLNLGKRRTCWVREGPGSTVHQ
jgi:hypothetical protein